MCKVVQHRAGQFCLPYDAQTMSQHVTLSLTFASRVWISIKVYKISFMTKYSSNIKIIKIFSSTKIINPESESGPEVDSVTAKILHTLSLIKCLYYAHVTNQLWETQIIQGGRQISAQSSQPLVNQDVTNGFLSLAQISSSLILFLIRNDDFFP